MNTQIRVLKRTALAVAITMVIGGVASLDRSIETETGMSSFISAAYAGDGGSGGGQKGAMGAGRGGQGGQGAGGQGQGQGQRGGKSVADVLADDGAEEDSDRPEWAGVPGRDGKPGGGNAGGSTQKGGDYGDLFVVLRDNDGEPIAAPGNEVYILLSDGRVVMTVDGEVPAAYADLAQPVEFGRMNIARAPDSVLEHSLTEALSKLDGLIITPETIATLTDASGRLLTNDNLTIDSPLENLALYEALLTAPTVDGMLVLSATSSHDGADATYTVLVDPAVRLDLAASAIAASSDKTGALTVDEIVLISSFMGVDDELGALVSGDYTYDKDAAFAGEEATILVDPEGDGTYITVTGEVLNLMNEYSPDAFNVIQQPVVMDYPNEADVQFEEGLTGISLFTQAADDAVQVLEFVHDTSAP